VCTVYRANIVEVLLTQLLRLVFTCILYSSPDFTVQLLRCVFCSILITIRKRTVRRQVQSSLGLFIW